MNTYVTGNVIKKLREESGLTQNSLAEKLGVSGKTVSKWETGKGYPDITLLEPIAKLLKVSVAELFSGETVTRQNASFNMKKVKFYSCPVCGNALVSTDNAVVCCHGITLPVLEAEDADFSHEITVIEVEDEYFVKINHEMTKEHYISFVAAVCDDGVLLIKLYPEGSAEARFKINKTERIFVFCNRHGLFDAKISRQKSEDMKREAKSRWGDTKPYKENAQKELTKTDTDKKSQADGLMWIFTKFGSQKEKSPDCDDVKKLVKQLQSYITENYYNCTDEILLSLGDTYVSDGRFKQNIDNAGGTGTAEFVNKAIKNYFK